MSTDRAIKLDIKRSFTCNNEVSLLGAENLTNTLQLFMYLIEEFATLTPHSNDIRNSQHNQFNRIILAAATKWSKRIDGDLFYESQESNQTEGPSTASSHRQSVFLLSC